MTAATQVREIRVSLERLSITEEKIVRQVSVSLDPTDVQSAMRAADGRTSKTKPVKERRRLRLDYQPKAAFADLGPEDARAHRFLVQP